MNSDSSELSSETESSDFAEKQLGDFKLLRRLGVGGMAEVYLAEQQSLNRLVAVKILQADLLSGKNDQLLKRFEQEARAAGGLSDTNIVQVYMIGHEGDVHFIVQEYVQGLNLSQWFRKNGCPDFLTGLKWMKQVAAALKVAAASGVVHRDIKPENIMLTPSGNAKVTDFGLAQLTEKEEKLNLTQQGTTMGTPWYMSPEQIQGERLDHRSDQYSFGVSCYHMFAGEPPFPGKNSVSVAVKHLKDEPPPLQERRRDLPEAMCRLIHRLMSKKPEDRYQTPDDLLDALDELDGVPLNQDLAIHGSTWDLIKASIPSPQFLLAGVLLCGIAGIAFGHMIFQSAQLQVKNATYPRMETASQQYAKAIIDPSNPEAWKAVYGNFPKSEEAIWSRLQLGIFYLTKRDDLSEADYWFSQAYETGFEHRDLQLLALVGQACVAEKQKDTDRLYKIQNVQLADYHGELRDESRLVPEVLRPMLLALQLAVLPAAED